MFRSFLRFFAIAALTLLTAAPAFATPVSVADLLDAKTDFAADFYLLSGSKGDVRGSVLHAPGRERREFDTPTGRQALLLRRDIDEATMMWPERKWFVSTSFSAAAGMAGLSGGIESVMLDRKAAGKETISGEPCARYDVNGTSEQGGEFHGRMWMTRDGILMKAAGTLNFQGRETKIEIGLLNLQRVAADPSAFVLPSDYKGLPLDFTKLGIKMPH